MIPGTDGEKFLLNFSPLFPAYLIKLFSLNKTAIPLF